jgi:hypothetical protein
VTLELEEGVTIRGRTFSREEILKIREIVGSSPSDHRNDLSKKVCQALGWYQENGRLKDRSCRDVLLRLQQAGLLHLPTPRHPPRPRRPIPLTARTDPRLPFPLEPREVGLEHFRIATGIKSEDALWNEFVERYHYLKFGTVVGPQIKYFVEVRGEPVACLSFGGAAWKVEPRDRWIGWTVEQRKRNLRYVVNNTRYLVLPWARVKNLASRILSLAAKRLPQDWQQLYGYRPCLLETFVHTERHAGTCYKAANWILVGATKGRGKMDRRNEAKLPKKAMYVYPLVPDARVLLTRSEHPETPTS